MDLWSVLEQRIKQHGVRVDERLNLLVQLKADHETGGALVAERREALVSSVDDAALHLKDTLRV